MKHTLMRLSRVAIVLCISALFLSCRSLPLPRTPTPSATAAITATSTGSPEIKPSATAIPSPTDTSTATATATASPTALPPTATSTATLTETPSPTPSASPSPTATHTETPEQTATPSPVPTLTTEEQAQALANQVSAERLMDDVRWLADGERRGRLAGSKDEDAAGEWLVQWFQTLALEPFRELGLDDYYMHFEVPGVTRYGRCGPGATCPAENVVAVLPGTTLPESYVAISAHYDHLGVRFDGQVYNGADDDATGVAAVLETARILSTSGLRPKESIVFLCFSAEEIGLLGSLAACDRIGANALNGRVAVLNMEVLGAVKGKGTYLDVWDEGVAMTEPLVTALFHAGGWLDVPLKRQGRDPGSDAVRLVTCGVPAVTVDVAWSRENHPHYHQPSDDPEHIDVDGFTDAVRVTVAALWMLANDGQ